MATTNIYETYRVTAEQVNACERTTNDLNQVIYIVASATTPGTEYKVFWNPIHKCLECHPHTGEACQASANGRNCWHKRASLAHAAELKEYRKLMQEKEEAQAVIEIAADIAHEVTLEEVQAAKAERKAVKADGNNAYNRKPFSLLR